MMGFWPTCRLYIHHHNTLGSFDMRKIAAATVFCLGVLAISGATAQLYYYAPPTTLLATPPTTALPSLLCKFAEYGVPNGGVSNPRPETLYLRTPDVHGKATWTFTLPADGINLAAYAYSIGDLRDIVPSGFRISSPIVFGDTFISSTTHARVLVQRQDLYTTSLSEFTPIDPNLTVSSSRYNFSTTNPLSASFSSSVETLVAANAQWSIVIQAIRVAPTGIGGALNPGWERNVAVCRLTVASTQPVLK
jgi:hypothetical protein